MCKISLFRINNCYELNIWHDILYVLVPSPNVISLCKNVGNTVIWNNLSLYCILVPYSLQCEWISLSIITLTTWNNDLLVLWPWNTDLLVFCIYRYLWEQFHYISSSTATRTHNLSHLQPHACASSPRLASTHFIDIFITYNKYKA